MCRLAAMINNEDNLPHPIKGKLANIMTNLFFLNSYGNTDGSGVMSMNKDGAVWGHKRAIPSYDFVHTKWYENFKKEIGEQRFVALHTRFSTVGGNTDANSHPFAWGDHVLMQNGTGHAHKGLVKGKVSPCAVDSESVCWSIANQGVEATFDAYRGAGAFMFLDKKAKTFSIIKNDERELAIAKIRNYEIYIVATEADALIYAIGKAGLEVEGWMADDIENGLLHTWGVDKVYQSTPMEVHPTTKYTYGTPYQGNSRVVPKSNAVVAQGGAPSTSGKSHTSTTSVTCNKQGEVVVDVIEDEEDEEANHDNLSTFNFIDDCALCSSPIDVTEGHGQITEFQNMYCCNSCMKEAYKQGYSLRYISGVEL